MPAQRVNRSGHHARRLHTVPVQAIQPFEARGPGKPGRDELIEFPDLLVARLDNPLDPGRLQGDPEFLAL